MDEKSRKQFEGLQAFLVKHGKAGGEALERMKVCEIRDRLSKKFKDMAVPMNHVEYAKENYDKLFPNNRVKTPVGEVKLGENQYAKLEANKRQKYLAGMHQTLTDPISITMQEDERGKTQVFAKSFRHNSKGKDGLISAVVNINGQPVSISTHPKKLSKVTEKIKKTADLVYEKPDSGLSAGNDPKVLVKNDDTQLLNNIPQPLPKVKKKG